VAILHETYAADKRGMARGIGMAGISFSPGIGPSPDGYLVEPLRWRLWRYCATNIPVQTEATFSRWVEQEGALLGYHDVFSLMAIIVLLTAVPVLWLRQRRVTT
jgi:hypothetical protein